MLAQNFKTATDLGISEIEQQSLVTVLGMLERGEIDDEHFNMGFYHARKGCGAVGCLCGWAYEVSGGRAFPEIPLMGASSMLVRRLPRALSYDLFAIGIGEDKRHPLNYARCAPTAMQGATTLRGYLTTGAANWAKALAE